MKHAKKLVSVPETEYNALLGLLTGNDPIKKEKFLTDRQIAANFKRPGLGALEKGVRYQALSRKRQNLNKKIEDKPMRVMLEHGRAAVLPTAGIAPAVRPQQQIQEIQQQEQQQVQPPQVEEEEAPAQPLEARKTRSKSIKQYHNLIDQNKLHRLKIRVDKFKEFFGINERGEVLANKDKSATVIKNSDYLVAMKYLTGNIEEPEGQTNTIKTLIPRLLLDDGVKELVSQDKRRLITGRGKQHVRKRYVVDLKTKPIKTIKTRGLTRFKPLLWSKIPV